MEDMEYTWLILWRRTVSSEDSLDTDGEAAACLRNSSHFSFKISRSSFSWFSSVVVFCRGTHGEPSIKSREQCVCRCSRRPLLARRVPRVPRCAADSAPGRPSPVVSGVVESGALHGPRQACGSCATLRCSDCIQTPRVPLFIRKTLLKWTNWNDDAEKDLFLPLPF